MKLPMIPQDKANHALYGAAVYVLARAVASFFAPEYASVLGLVASAAFGLGKEVVDFWLNRQAAQKGQRAPHTPMPADALATAAGGFLCYLAGVSL